MKLKVCGITTFDQLHQLEELEVDYAGLIFYEKSPRYAVGKMETSKIQRTNLNIAKVGVFVNAPLEMIIHTAKEYNLQYVQLHGDEPAAFCKQVNQELPVIKAIRINDNLSLAEKLSEYADACTYFLFDTDGKQYGGTGKQFDWKILHEASINKPFFLSGGIGSEYVEKIKQMNHLFLHAIDVNSRFEISPGVKDMEKIKTFVHQLKNQS